MSVTVHCRNCGKLLRSADKYADRRVRCPDCQTINRLPEGDAAATTEAAESADPSQVCTLCGQAFSIVDAKVKDVKGNVYHRNCYDSAKARLQRQGAVVSQTVGVHCGCGRPIRFGMDHAARLVQCNHCGRVYRLPSTLGMVHAQEEVCGVCGESFSLDPHFAFMSEGGRQCHAGCSQQAKMSDLLDEEPAASPQYGPCYQGRVRVVSAQAIHGSRVPADINKILRREQETSEGPSEMLLPRFWPQDAFEITLEVDALPSEVHWAASGILGGLARLVSDGAGTSGDPTVHRLVGRVRKMGGEWVVVFLYYDRGLVFGHPILMPGLDTAVVTVEVASGGGGRAFVRVCGVSRKTVIGGVIGESVAEEAAGWMVEELRKSLR